MEVSGGIRHPALSLPARQPTKRDHTVRRSPTEHRFRLRENRGGGRVEGLGEPRFPAPTPMPVPHCFRPRKLAGNHLRTKGRRPVGFPRHKSVATTRRVVVSTWDRPGREPLYPCSVVRPLRLGGLTGSICMQCPVSRSQTRGGDWGNRCTHVAGHRPSFNPLTVRRKSTRRPLPTTRFARLCRLRLRAARRGKAAVIFAVVRREQLGVDPIPHRYSDSDGDFRSRPPPALGPLH